MEPTLEPAHAVYSPSQLPRIILCPASIKEATYAPLPTSSAYAKRGTFLHDIVVQAYTNGRAWLSKTMLTHSLTLDEMNWIGDCLDYIDLIMKQCSDEAYISLENQVSLKTFGLDEVWGTADVIIKDPGQSVCHVIDWKFGSGVQVFVEHNEQLLAYGAGSVGFPSQYREINLHVVQPPLSHFDTWKITYEELKAWVFDKLAPAIELAKSKDPAYCPGDKQCRWCAASMTCRARHTRVQDVAKQVFKTYSNLTRVSKDELKETLDVCDEYIKYINEIKAFAFTELLHGRGFTGYKIVAGRSTRQWKVPDAEVLQWLKNHSAIKDIDLYKRKLISPPQAEKLDRVLKKHGDFQKIVNKPAGKPVMAPEGDKRPALDPNAGAMSAFSELADE